MSCHSHSKAPRFSDTLATNKLCESLALSRKPSSGPSNTFFDPQTSSLRLALKKQLIELREEKEHHDYLFSKLSGLKHKLQLLEDEFAKGEAAFAKRQGESQQQLAAAGAELAAVKKRIGLKEKEFEELRENFERLVFQAHGYESQIKENLELHCSAESRTLKEKEELEETGRRKSASEEERLLLRKKREEVAEELDELDNQLRFYKGLEAEALEKTDVLLLEIRTSENKKESLELNFEKLSDAFAAKTAEKGELASKIEAAENAFEQVCSANKADLERIKKLQKANLECERKLTESESKLMQVEKRKIEAAKEKSGKDNEIIEQAKKLKQMDFELESVDFEIKNGQESLEGLLSFHEKLLRTLARFEEENQALLKLVSNTEELKEAIWGLNVKIDEARKCLSEI